MINTTTVRAIALGMSLGFVLAVVPSCGTKPPTAKCNRNTCPGCCDTAGECYSGISPEACGLDGITCSACKTGQSCSSEGVCRNPGNGDGGTGGGVGSGGGTGSTGGGKGGGTGGGTGTGGGVGTGGGMGTGGGSSAGCSNLTCANGCCNPVNGACQVGDQNTQCGGGGLACKVCNTGAGQTCMNGACVGGNCDPTTCPTGCCSNNVCVTSINANQCGLNGVQCVTCQGANPTCELDAGTCLGGGTGGGSGGTGGFGGFGGFGGSGGLDLCSLAGTPCTASQCCDLFLCVNSGAACVLTSGTTCNSTTLKCQ